MLRSGANSLHAGAQVTGDAGRVSVAMCTCNGERFLAHQLASILSQTVLPDELVICDDVSTDATLGIVEQFAQTAPFPVKLVRNPVRLGVAKNFEQAMRLCQSQYIALCDQDDMWVPEKLARLCTLLDAHPDRGYSCSDAELIDRSGQLMAARLWETYKTPPGQFLTSERTAGDTERAASQILVKSNRVVGATLVLRASLRQFMQPIPSSWVHDHWLTFLAEVFGAHGIATDEPLTHYRLHAGQTCGLRKASWWAWAGRKKGPSRLAKRRVRMQRLVDLSSHLDRFTNSGAVVANWAAPMLERAAAHARQQLAEAEAGWWSWFVPQAKARTGYEIGPEQEQGIPSFPVVHEQKAA